MSQTEGSFGGALFLLRSQRGLSQTLVASRARIERGYYSQLENSRKGPPSPEVMHRIITALELSESQAYRLKASAIADRCNSECRALDLPEALARVLRTVVHEASAITKEKASRIEAILKEE